MTKRPNLAHVAEAAGSTRRAAIPEPQEPTLPAPSGPMTRTRTRQSTKQIAGHFPEEVAWQLRELAVERRSTVQALIGEALNDLFRKYGKPELAPTETGRAA